MNDSNNQRNSRSKPKQGPRAKNTHWWKHTVPQTVTRRRNAKWGGAAKNERSGSRKDTSNQLLVGCRKQSKKGPRAKNRRP